MTPFSERPKRPTRYAIYARVSTQDRGQYLENQLPDLHRYIEDAAGTLFEVFTDEASGGKAARPGFKRMLTAAHQRRFDVLLFWSLKRFSREGSLATLDYLKQLSSAGVNFKSYTEQFLDTTTPIGAGIVALMAALGAQDLVLLSEQTKAGLRRVVAAGGKLGRPALSPAIIEQARALRDAGQSHGKISKALGVAVGTLHPYLARPA